MRGFFEELKRRNVFRAGAAYAVTAWIVLQVANVIFPPLDVPAWVMTGLTILAILGFPITIVISWIYEWTPEGLMTAQAADAAGYVKPAAFGRQIDFVVIALLAIAVGWLVWRQQGLEPIFEVESNSIAVLPFIDLSPEGDQEYFSDGISEELLNVLAQVPDLRVAARTSSFRFRGEVPDIQDIARQLNVAHVVEGSVRRGGDSIRITAQLIDAGTGFHLWSATYDRKLDDIFATQDEISAAIVDALKDFLVDESTPRLAISRAANTKAYDLYLLGRHHFERRTVEELERAQDYFERAIESDPGYAPAYNGLADTLLLLSRGAFGSLPPEETRARVLPLILKALEIDPTLPETHASLGFLRRMEQDYLAAETALKRAIELSPNMARAHNWLYITYDGASRHREAFEALERALELDPLSAIVNANMAAELWSRGRTQEALTAAGRVIQIAPQSPMGYGRFARILWTQGHLAAAVGWYAQAENAAPGDPVTGREFGYLYLNLGDYRTAETLLGDWRHVVYLAEGRLDEAIADVRQNLAARPGDRRTIVAAARTEAWAGHFDESRRLLEAMAEGSDNGRGPLFQRANLVFWNPSIGALDLALARARTGENEGAKLLLAQVRAFFENLRAEGLDHPAIAYQEARIFALEGRADEALRSLRKAIDRGWRFWYTGGDPALESLRGAPAFKAMVSEIDAYVAEEWARLEAAGESSSGG